MKKPFRLINVYNISVSCPKFPARNTARTISPSRMGWNTQRCRSTEAWRSASFKNAQHWDLRNNQLRSTLGSRSDSLGCCWGAASGASFLSPKVGFFETKVKNVWLWARMIRCRCRNVSWMQKFGEWDRWIHEGQMVGANESSAQCQLMTFFHSQVTTTVTVSRFPLFFEVTNLQCSNGASVADSSKATKAKPVLTIPADGNVCLFVFLIFLVLTRKERETKTSQLT